LFAPTLKGAKSAYQFSLDNLFKARFLPAAAGWGKKKTIVTADFILPEFAEAEAKLGVRTRTFFLSFGREES
jgi:hypothetical protein